MDALCNSSEFGRFLSRGFSGSTDLALLFTFHFIAVS